MLYALQPNAFRVITDRSDARDFETVVDVSPADHERFQARLAEAEADYQEACRREAADLERPGVSTAAHARCAEVAVWIRMEIEHSYQFEAQGNAAH